MHFTIERAGLLKRRFRARLKGANNELWWHTQTYADKRDAMFAIAAINQGWPVHDRT